MLKFHKAENADLASLRFPCLVMPKVDGVRGAFLNSGFTGRSGKAFKNQNITDCFSNPAYRGFDGELFHGNMTDPDLCRKTTGLVNSLRYNTHGELPKLMVFDWITEETIVLPYRKRFELVTAYIQDLSPELRQYITTVPRLVYNPEYLYCHTVEEVEEAHLEYVAQGYEGTIIRWAEAPHKNGRSTVRESYFMRIKDVLTSEGIVIGYTEAEENLNTLVYTPQGYAERSSAQEGKVGKGMLGALILSFNGQEIKCSAGKMTHEERYDYWDNPQKLLGRIAVFNSMAYGEKDCPRHARFIGWRADEDFDTGDL